jgi:exo-beta-1,3-glucanase (GH17 family)
VTENDRKKTTPSDIIADEALMPKTVVEKTLKMQEQELATSKAVLTLNTKRRKQLRWALVFFFISVYLTGTVIVLNRYSEVPVNRPTRATIRGDWFYRDGYKFLVKGVGWDPARPGELPWARKKSIALVDDDFRRIRQAGFNTIRTWEALTWNELVAAERHGLAVLQGIWIKPDGDFKNEKFQKNALQKIRDIVGYSRESRAVIGYLIMNEPEAEHVLSQGEDATRKLLRILSAEVRKLDPVALVAFSNWPGVEFLIEPDFDFAGVNLYPFRPEALIQAVGYEGMVRLWKDLHAANRPLLVTEYGISVSPNKPIKANAPGGASEEEQARRLPELADRMIAAGSAGGVVFAWNDGWWKGQNRPDDVMFHDVNDAEEWFGLLAMEGLDDLHGRERPALESMRRWNRIVVTSPKNGPVDEHAVLLEIHAENETGIKATASLNGNDAIIVPLTREGPWSRGWIGLSIKAKGAQQVEIFVYNKSGMLLRQLKRTLYPPGQLPRLKIDMDKDGNLDVLALDGKGKPLPNAKIRVAIFNSSHTQDFQTVIQTGEFGTGSVKLPLPDKNGAFVAAGLWQTPGDPPAAVKGFWINSPSE